METFGGIIAILVFAKIGFRSDMLSHTEENFSLLDYLSRFGPLVASFMLLPNMDVNPKVYRLLKKIINILYTVSFIGLIIFLSAYNTQVLKAAAKIDPTNNRNYYNLVLAYITDNQTEPTLHGARMGRLHKTSFLFFAFFAGVSVRSVSVVSEHVSNENNSSPGGARTNLF